MRTAILIMIVALFLLSGCAASQKLTVHTHPPGARVTLIKYGVTEARGGIKGITVGGETESFEQGLIDLGTSPLEYEFRLEEEGRHLSAPGLFVKVVNKYTEGLIRAQLDGRFAERRVQFSGDPLLIKLTIEATGTPVRPLGE